MRLTTGFVLLFILASTVDVVAQVYTADAIVGTWLTADKTGQINIYKHDNLYYGKIVAGTSNEKFDVKNPEKSRRGDPLLGLIILRDLAFEKNVWRNGTVYDPKNGKTYSCTITLTNLDTLEIRGFVGFSWIGRSELWRRVK
jgi:uncharacterized protein (DUF2147 family)